MIRSVATTPNVVSSLRRAYIVLRAIPLHLLQLGRPARPVDERPRPHVRWTHALRDQIRWLEIATPKPM